MAGQGGCRRASAAGRQGVAVHPRDVVRSAAVLGHRQRCRGACPPTLRASQCASVRALAAGAPRCCFGGRRLLCSSTLPPSSGCRLRPPSGQRRPSFPSRTGRAVPPRARPRLCARRSAVRTARRRRRLPHRLAVLSHPDEAIRVVELKRSAFTSEALLTTDTRLATAPGITCPIELLCSPASLPTVGRDASFACPGSPLRSVGSFRSAVAGTSVGLRHSALGRLPKGRALVRECQIRSESSCSCHCLLDLLASGDEQRERHDRDPVRPSVGLRAGVENDRVDAVVAEFVSEPAQVRDVAVVDGC